VGSSPASALRFGGVAREDHAHVGTVVRGRINPRDRFVEPFEAAGIAARDDDKILVALIALPTGEPDLIYELFSRNHMRDVFVVMRPFGEKLVLYVDPSDPRIDEFTHGAHRVQRLAKASAGIREHRNLHCLGDIAGYPDLLIQRQ
jgi:hypothetical protein